jgi:hypothetical protein
VSAAMFLYLRYVLAAASDEDDGVMFADDIR